MKPRSTWEHQRKRIIGMVIGLTLMAIAIACGGFALEQGSDQSALSFYCFAGLCFCFVLYEMGWLLIE